VPNSSLERLTAERALPERHPAPRPSPPPLSVGLGARDRTLGRADRHRVVDRLFWLLILLPALLATFIAGPLAGLAILPLQVLAAILVGTAVARKRQCGAMTLASLPLTAFLLLWAAATL
jgi:hypothetical protein